MKTFYCKSFNYGSSGGNPAGVVFLENGELPEEKMQKIAEEIGFSETAFVEPLDYNVYSVRFFTPTTEVDLCGHATIAAFYCLAEMKLREGIHLPEIVWQETRSGKLAVMIVYEGDSVKSVLMEQAEPVEYQLIAGDLKKKVARSLSLEPEDLIIPNKDIQPRIVSTGLKDIIIPVKNRTTLNRMDCDIPMIAHISRELDVTGYHVFTFDGSQIYTRNFGPAVGIDEECATGTSNGALSYLLYSRGIIDSYVEILQGESMGQLSKITARVTEENGKYKVMVGGTAFITDELDS